MERRKNTIMPFFSLHMLWVVGLKGKTQCALRGVGGMRAPGVMFMSTLILMKHQVGNVVGTSQEILRPDLHYGENK